MAVELDGVDNYIHFGEMAEPGIGPFTICGWFQVANVTSRMIIFSDEAHTNANQKGIIRIEFRGDEAGDYLNYTTRKNDATGIIISVGTTTLVANTWYHVAMTRTGTTGHFLINASTDKDDTIDAGSYTNDDSTLMGRYSHTGADWMAGKLEDWRYYEKVLTDEQIARLVSGYRGPVGGEVGWWSGRHFQGVSHPDGAVLTADTHYLPNQSSNSNPGNPIGGVTARASDAPYAGSGVWTSILTGISQVVGGSITNTGALIRDTRKLTAGAITNTGSLTRLTKKVVAGAITNTGSLTRLTKKVVAGAITNTGSLVRLTKKVVAGAITNTGALTTVKAVLQKFYTWTASFRASDREDPYHAGSDEKRGRA